MGLGEQPLLEQRDRAQVELAREGDDGCVSSRRLDTHRQALAVGPRFAVPRKRARWSGPARPLHPLASTRHPLVVRSSHGAGSLEVLVRTGRDSTKSSSVPLILCLPRKPDPPPARACLQAGPGESQIAGSVRADPSLLRVVSYSSSSDAELEVPGIRVGDFSNGVFPLTAQEQVTTPRT